MAPSLLIAQPLYNTTPNFSLKTSTPQRKAQELGAGSLALPGFPAHVGQSLDCIAEVSSRPGYWEK